MQRAGKNINELLETLHGTFHRLRQTKIDEELFDVISGFEALAKPRKAAGTKLNQSRVNAALFPPQTALSPAEWPGWHSRQLAFAP